MGHGVLYLDTETTGIGDDAELLEVAIVDDEGAVVIDTLVNPGCRIPADATKIHGITDAMVRDAPAVAEIRRRVAAIVSGRHVVIYNADFDTRFLRLGDAASVRCCMLRYAAWHREWSEARQGWRWHRLQVAAARVGYAWPEGGAHRALADARACRHVWRWLDAAEGSGA